jgi:hypothetical protein
VIVWQDVPVRKAAPSNGDVTQLVDARYNPVLDQGPIRFGFMLIGEPLDFGKLMAND